jgi:hypothetical protein
VRSSWRPAGFPVHPATIPRTESLSQSISGLTVSLLGGLRIHRERRPRVGVTEAFLRRPDVHPLFEQRRAGRVLQVVEVESG